MHAFRTHSLVVLGNQHVDGAHLFQLGSLGVISTTRDTISVQKRTDNLSFPSRYDSTALGIGCFDMHWGPRMRGTLYSEV